eukprot:241387-Alexandrium_andersonii.AAC.1
MLGPGPNGLRPLAALARCSRAAWATADAANRPCADPPPAGDNDVRRSDRRRTTPPNDLQHRTAALTGLATGLATLEPAPEARQLLLIETALQPCATIESRLVHTVALRGCCIRCAGPTT